MASKAQRGTKRTCQNGSCGARFYDLARDPIVCPVCSTVYVIAVTPTAAADAAAQRRPVKKPEFVAPEAAEAVNEGEDALADVEGAEEPIEAADDETFLEEEEDEGNVSGILPGSQQEGEEET